VRVAAHVLAIRLRQVEYGIFAATTAHAEFTRREDDTRGQALDVPLPGGLERFVEIVDVEQELALGAGESAEIRSVAIAAGLHANSGGGSFREIPSHHCRRTTEKCKRGLAHAAIADGQKVGEAAAIGLAQDFDGIGTVGRSGPLGVGVPRDAFPQSFSPADALFDAGPQYGGSFAWNAVNFSAVGGHGLGMVEGVVADDSSGGDMVAPGHGASHEDNSALETLEAPAANPKRGFGIAKISNCNGMKPIDAQKRLIH